jgi:hypothetical protein
MARERSPWKRSEDGTRTRYPRPRLLRTLRVRDGGLDLIRFAA